MAMRHFTEALEMESADSISIVIPSLIDTRVMKGLPQLSVEVADSVKVTKKTKAKIMRHNALVGLVEKVVLLPTSVRRKLVSFL